ncbi:hypothetical protein D3C81_1116710 [compost metagenome]
MLVKLYSTINAKLPEEMIITNITKLSLLAESLLAFDIVDVNVTFITFLQSISLVDISSSFPSAESNFKNCALYTAFSPNICS